MFDKLIDTIEKCGCIAVYPWEDRPTKLLIGYILYVNSNWLALGLVGPEGEDDGVFLCAWSRIFRVEIGTRYNEDVTCGRVGDKTIEKDRFSEERLFSYAVENHVPVSVMLKDGREEICGVIDSIVRGSLILRDVSEDGGLYGCRIDDGNLAYLWFEVPASEI